MSNYTPWNKDPQFQKVLTKISANTLVDKFRLWELWTLVEQSAKLEGSLLEVGAWRGGTAGVIGAKARECGIRDPFYVADTFKGVVKADEQDADYRGGEHSDTTRGIVENLLHRDLDLPGIRILEGIFPDETGHEAQNDRFRFCHIDVDVYQSAKDIGDWIWPRLVIGGIVVYDDYGFKSTPGVTRLVDEQRALSDRIVLHNLNGHAIVIKVV
ncbi:TylF/MycF/NovP-related O-methyltransferase [Singulisphaera sp. GP187]|uniref:TylF/MycF/NovP-related O-methyltransferase n=1 Tax=Singulisphaera sp. GP187 TaxID=1882752 RepID=UPI001C1FBF45|nr:TylF/MycF/NovP-related O-methyltransferase [Singulisphaera sp. GP187]